jgi:anthranilate phosphoribosyltransferase
VQLTDADCRRRWRALLAALRTKGVSRGRGAWLCAAMRRLARRPALPAGCARSTSSAPAAIASGSLNLSTGTALLTAACGLPVVKHGNRSVSSRAAAPMCLQALGLAGAAG